MLFGFVYVKCPELANSKKWKYIYFPLGSAVKNPPANAGDSRHRFNPWLRRIPGSRKWQPTLVFLLGSSHRQRSLAKTSPWGHKKFNLAE